MHGNCLDRFKKLWKHRIYTLGRVAVLLIMVFSTAKEAMAVQLQDLVRLKGSETSKIVGMGLVVGLNGTGDGGRYQTAIRLLAQTTRYFVDENAIPADAKDSKNVAVVYLEATVPATGVQEGNHIDLHVSAVGKAKSLKGGRLIMAPMTGPSPRSPQYAWASGPITIQNPEIPTVGVVSGGAQMIEDVTTKLTDKFGRIRLVVNSQIASWPVAYNIAALINGIMAPDGPGIAAVVDQTNILIDVPMDQRSKPAQFIAQILRTYIDQSQIDTGARVLVNERSGQIVFGAHVEISPVLISAPGIIITTITPPQQPTPEPPTAEESYFIKLDPADRGGTKLGQLMKALEQMKVPAVDRIAIIKDLHKHGGLHAQLILE